jgi:type II restriction enzyme
MESVLPRAILSVEKSRGALCKVISPNDAGATKSHQAGFLIPKSAYSLFFDSPGKKGEIRDAPITIKWQDDFETQSRFVYYGQKSRNEYRITRFQRGFPYRSVENIGDLLVIARHDNSYYEAFVLSTDHEVDDFFSAFNIPPTDEGLILKRTEYSSEKMLTDRFSDFVRKLNVDFPDNQVMSAEAREIYQVIKGIGVHEVRESPDSILIKWIELEYDLFKAIENDRYQKIIDGGFRKVGDLIEFANRILNRRKSRAGRSLENHLAEIFRLNQIRFSQQVRTEGRRKPDFIFPGAKEYHDKKFNVDGLTFLACKTTCKDRWRQILKEAAKTRSKYLFTLQKAISSPQLKEMQEEDVTLVVPSSYVESFDEKFAGTVVISLSDFIEKVRSVQEMDWRHAHTKKSNQP